MEEWQAQGAPVAVDHVHLAPFPRWIPSGTPEFQIGILGLNDRLLPEVGQFYAQGLEAIRLEAEPGLDRIRARAVRRTALAKEGASGTIDELAVRVIEAHRPLAETLRQLREQDIVWLTDDDAIRWDSGHVLVAKRDFDQGISWLGNDIVVDALILSDERAEALIGRPVTEIAKHAFLDARMLIEEIMPKEFEGHPRVSFTVAMPRLYFDAETGKTW